MSDLFENTEDRVFHDAAHFKKVLSAAKEDVIIDIVVNV